MSPEPFADANRRLLARFVFHPIRQFRYGQIRIHCSKISQGRLSVDLNLLGLFLHFPGIEWVCTAHFDCAVLSLTQMECASQECHFV
jgi:hypothetical protein